MTKIKFIITLITLFAFVLQGCKKTEEVFEDPYGNGKEPLGIIINQDTPPVPANGIAGTEVTVDAKGLMPFKEGLVFMFNGEKAEILEVTESHVKVKVPANASSGFTSIAVGDKLVIGPSFTVDGLINIDPGFVAKAGTNGWVSQFYGLADGRYLLLGAFTNFDNKGIVSPLNRIVKISVNGDLDRSFRVGKGANGTLTRVIEVGGKFIISGAFSGFNQRTENISNITSLNSNGSVDTTGIHTYRRPGQTDTVKFFPKFNGGTNSGIGRIYNVDDKIIATGNFRYYVTRRYDRPNYDERKDTVMLDSTEIRQIVRMLPDGSLDKTYRFNQSTGKGFIGANGSTGSFMHTDGTNAGKLIIYGDFSSFDGAAAGRITRLNPDGTIDRTFKAGVGADDAIWSLTYNASLQKYMVVGQFKTFNGVPSGGIALINLDGTPDNSFVVKSVTGGIVYFAKQLNNGLIIVNGSFKNYNNVAKSGFMVLTATGELAPGYNATGLFSGNLSDIIETQSADNKQALLLIGGFDRFDNKEVHNIIRVTIEK